MVALPLAPLFLAIPSFATAPALIFVGLLMFASVKDMDFGNDTATAMAGFIAIIMMPFTYSIANGIMFGILAYVVLRVFQGKAKSIHPVMWISAALFIARVCQLVMGL